MQAQTCRFLPGLCGVTFRNCPIDAVFVWNTPLFQKSPNSRWNSNAIIAESGLKITFPWIKLSAATDASVSFPVFQSVIHDFPEILDNLPSQVCGQSWNTRYNRILNPVDDVGFRFRTVSREMLQPDDLPTSDYVGGHC